MIATLNGSPLARTEGDLKISRKNALKSMNVLVNEAMRKHPMTIVERQVRPNSAMFTQGNRC